MRKDFKTISKVLFYLGFCLITGCRSSQTQTQIDAFGSTIGSEAQVVGVESVSVEGYGLVGRLNSTGSTLCPPQIRSYLIRYLVTEFGLDSAAEAGILIDSPETAVVFVEAQMPVDTATSKYFDVKVTALPGTEATSLEGGWLYRTEMKVAGSFGLTTDVLAGAEGPVFIDKISSGDIDTNSGYILGGGAILTEHQILVLLNEENYALTNLVRNRVNERFGANVARAASLSQVLLTVPQKYNQQREKFIKMVEMTYLDDSEQLVQQRISALVQELAASPEDEEAALALEVIGNRSVSRLSNLLTSSDQRVRFKAAEILLNIGDSSGLPTLRQIALDRQSVHRLDAFTAMAEAAGYASVETIALNLLNDADFDIRFAAYKYLRKNNNSSVQTEMVSYKFFLEQIEQTNQKSIYVSRSGQPRIVLFGSPIYCHRDIFIQSPDGKITIQASALGEYISLSYTDNGDSDAARDAFTSFDISNIIRALCTEPSTQLRSGLGVSYADMIALLRQMFDKGVIDAEFHIGPLP